MIQDQIARIDGLVVSPLALDVRLFSSRHLKRFIEIMLPVEIQRGLIDAQKVRILGVLDYLRDQDFVQVSLILCVWLVVEVLLDLVGCSRPTFVMKTLIDVMVPIHAEDPKILRFFERHMLCPQTILTDDAI